MASTNAKQGLMRSTWKSSGNEKKWTHDHYMLYAIDGSYKYHNMDPPVHSKTDKIPVLSVWRSGGWMLVRSMIPVLIDYALQHYAGLTMSPWVALAFYFTAEALIAVNHLHTLTWLGLQYGFFDGNVPRDGVPDLRVGQVARSLLMTAGLRAVMMIFISWKPDETFEFDIRVTPWLLVLQVTVYTISLDFWFYWYHRLMHEIDFLWRYHKTHHQTKHPNPLLSLYADVEQEWFDIVGIPMMAYVTTKIFVPFGFYEWWIAGLQVLFIEAWGHSGIRVYATPANAGLGFLRWFGAELTIEVSQRI